MYKYLTYSFPYLNSFKAKSPHLYLTLSHLIQAACFFPRRQGPPSLASLLGCSGESGCEEVAHLQHKKRGKAEGKAQRKHQGLQTKHAKLLRGSWLQNYFFLKLCLVFFGSPWHQ